MRWLFKVLSFLPLSVLHAVGWAFGWLAFFASSTYRRRLLTNARQGGTSMGSWLRSVGAAGKMIAELPRLWMGAAPEVRWEGAHYIENALSEGRGILFLTPHLGCFEMTAMAYAARYGQQAHPITVLFRPPRKTWLRELVESSRERPGLKTAPTTLAGVKQLVRALKAGECVGLLPDQVPPDGLGQWVPFFGKEAYTMSLAVRLAGQTGASVVFAWGERLSWGRGYCVHVLPSERRWSSDTSTALQQMNESLEAMVSAAADQYLWGYARYKKPKSEPR